MNISDFLKHVRLFHAHQPNFFISCGIGGCLRTFQNFSTFKNHVSDRHSCELYETSTHQQRNPEESHCLEEFSEDVTNDLSSENLLSTTQQSSAYFLMGLKEERKLTQTALQGVIEGVTTLTQARLALLHNEVDRI